MRALDVFKIYMPIFSRDYASSSWCLREVAHMVDCEARSNGNKEILPVFYDVSPSDVRLRTERYRNAMTKHSKRFGAEEVKRWGDALVKVAELKGWDLKARGHGEAIKLIIREVLVKLKIKHKNVTNQLVGADDRVEDIMKLLDVDREGICFVSIHWMGGFGKTTLVKVLFNQLCSHFDDCCFLGNVRESSEKEGLVNLQKQIYSDILDSRFVDSIHDTGDEINQIGTRFRNKKVLIVLDDVDKEEQLEKLAGAQDWLGSGSRIIITTRNENTLRIVDGDTLWMHDHLKDLGRQIVQRECLHDPGEHSRVWICEEALDIVRIKQRKKKVQALILTRSHYKPLVIMDDVLSRLPNLRFLELEEGTFAGDFGDDFSKLRWISWYSPRPLDLEVANLSMKNLVVFEIIAGSITDDWSAWSLIKMAKNLKVLNLKGCEGITRTPDIFACFSLERLSFYNCINLVKIDPSIEKLKRLIYLNLKECLSLKDLPEEVGRYTQISILPETIGKLVKLLSVLILSTKIVELPDSIGNLKKLKVILMENTPIRKLPSTIGMLKNLEELHASDCEELRGEIPREIGALSSLKVLESSDAHIS
ncbi:disease resistance protein RUN1-like [Eucalyptus grandis]|uniref:disease resistance protein RUN1-like n=1 Tax=Eucalyptus grandis TaxID=71139 RepID=UPI00192EED96|nr:disease resistance protein RUN1-like [Eucalyptus grandis]